MAGGTVLFEAMGPFCKRSGYGVTIPHLLGHSPPLERHQHHQMVKN